MHGFCKKNVRIFSLIFLTGLFTVIFFIHEIKSFVDRSRDHDSRCSINSSHIFHGDHVFCRDQACILKFKLDIVIKFSRWTILFKHPNCDPTQFTWETWLLKPSTKLERDGTKVWQTLHNYIAIIKLNATLTLWACTIWPYLETNWKHMHLNFFLMPLNLKSLVYEYSMSHETWQWYSLNFFF